MRISFSDRALVAISGAPPSVRKAFGKQMAFLERDLRHPSLRAKIEGDTYRIQDVIPHPK